jgi:hypothetical protein
VVNFFENNAYRTLGLDSSATQKEIQKRSKEIIRLIQIDEIPKYEIDLDAPTIIRSEATIKDAVGRLSSPKKQIVDYFFWFLVLTDIDEAAIDKINSEDTYQAIDLWEKNIINDSSQSLLYKKNLAILYCNLLFQNSNKEYLRKSLEIWSQLINSTKFWENFSKVFKMNDELQVDQSVISTFHKDCVSYLSEIYSNLYQLYSDDLYINQFKEFFGTFKNESDNSILEPIFKEMSLAVEILESMNVSEDGILDNDEASQIKSCITVIEESSEKLNKLSLYESSQAKIMRDRAVQAIRSISIDIHNNLGEVPKAEELLKIAQKFVGTAGMGKTLEQDLDTFNNNKAFNALIDPIDKLIQETKFTDALALIDKEISNHWHMPDIAEALFGRKKRCITDNSITLFLKAKEQYDAKNYDGAILNFTKTIESIYNYLESFDVNVETVNQWLEMIRNSTSTLTAENAHDLDLLVNEMKEIIDNKLKGTYDQYAIKVLIDSHVYRDIARILKKKMNDNAISTVIGWVVIMVIYAMISGIFH